MAIFYGIDSNYASSLFSSLNTGKAGTSNGLTDLLSEYSSIQSGSYRRLLNAYYGDSDKGSIKSADEKKSISTSKDDTKELTEIKNSADSLGESIEKLGKTGSKSLFAKEYKTTEDGSTKGTYNLDKIYDAVKEFTDNYNSLVEAAEDADTKSIASNMKSIITNTKANKDMLEDIGITINSDSTLSIDEETFKKADMSVAKSLFNGTGSYAYQTGVKASMVSMNVSIETARSNTYQGDGSYSYNYSSGDLYNTLF